jgi:hypothetical protein
VDPEAPSGRLGRTVLAGTLATGAALIAVAITGLVGVDRQLQAATPRQTVPVSQDVRHHPCPAHRHRAAPDRDRSSSY